MPLWVDIEKVISPTKDLTLLLMGNRWAPWDTTILSPPMQTSLKAWRFLLGQNHQDTQKTNYELPLTLLESKIPLIDVKDLTDQGITYISDLYEGTQYKSANQIMTQYHLMSDKLFTCLRHTFF